MARVIPVPQNAEELREQLTDRATMRELMQDSEKFADHVESSINARLKDGAINAQVNQQTEAFMINWLREQKGQDATNSIAHRLNLDNPNARARIRPNTVYNKKALGAKHDNTFATTAEFLHTISAHGFKNDDTSRKLESLRNDLSSVKPSDGGFLIPEVLRAELLRVSLESAIVRSRARVIPMDSLTVPFPMVDSTSNVSSVYGGVTGFWTEEGATLTESQPKFGRVELKANKLVLYCEVPNELIRDAQPAMEAFINDIFPEAIAWFEDVAFFVGAGVGEPLGFLNAPAMIHVTRSTTVAGNNVEWADIANMYSRMLPQSLGRAVWVISPDVMPSLLTAQLPGGGPLIVSTGGGFPTATGQPIMTLLGCPIIVSEKARAIGAVGDINFVDFGFYLLGDRQAMSARQSEEFRFQNDLTAFRVIERLDGRPWLASAITPQNNGVTLSPFVNLTVGV
jgi:HK97 family phage major capsid protein